ncbi:MAG: hypothetical protein AB7O97_21790 [Planctomycetota bacterium]
MTEDVLEDDELRFVDVLAEELLTAPGAEADPQPRALRWLVAAVVALAASVVVALTALREDTASTTEVQDPSPVPAPTEVSPADAEALANLLDEVTGIRVQLLAAHRIVPHNPKDPRGMGLHFQDVPLAVADVDTAEVHAWTEALRIGLEFPATMAPTTGDTRPRLPEPNNEFVRLDLLLPGAREVRIKVHPNGMLSSSAGAFTCRTSLMERIRAARDRARQARRVTLGLVANAAELAALPTTATHVCVEPGPDETLDPAVLEALAERPWRSLSVPANLDAAALASLARLGSLQTLELRSTQRQMANLSAEALRDLLTRLPDLRELHLTEGRFGDAHLEALPGTRLRHVHLESTRVTSVGLQHLAGLEALRVLTLIGFPLEKPVEMLTGLPRLERLELQYVSLGCGLDELRRVRPECRIVVGNGVSETRNGMGSPVPADDR